MKRILLFLTLFTFIQPTFSQVDYFKNFKFTEADTLRGMLRPERTCYDVTFYDLQIKVDIDKKHISGYNEIHYKAVDDFSKIQIDLFDNMKINEIVFEGKKLNFERKFNAVFIDFPKQKKGVTNSFTVHYEGAPIAAKNPPWDGGFVWRENKNGEPWVAVSCEGIGASLWFPNKDHLYDEPDSVRIGVAVPTGLTCIANGNLEDTQEEGNYTRFNWFVSYPINNYNITLNITKYAHFSDTYKSEDGEELDLDYYVLPENLEKAEKHFQQVKPMLACYEKFFGKYPFWNDGYALVETPYLGMEHQSAIAYGNQYMRGYLGRLIPDGIDFDYIIIHETGHEYWGNSISCSDHAEMWIHESFCTYSEALYVEYMYNFEEAVRYLAMQKMFVKNKKPILGPMNVNFDGWGHSDHYYKGAWILHTLRNSINDDEKWFGLIKSFYQKHKISVISTEDFVTYASEYIKRDLSKFFEQYLEHPTIPTLLYRIKKSGNGVDVSVVLKSDVKQFGMPILMGDPDNYRSINVSSSKSNYFFPDMKVEDFKVADELFLINVKELD
jgi:aminopeptidase N